MRKSFRKARPQSPAEWERCDVKHARARLGERYGLYLSELEYWELVSRIQMAWMPEHKAKLVHQQAANRHLYELTVQGHAVIAVWAPPLQRILTFLPRQEALANIGITAEASA
jgi:hypothetical protein